MRRPILAISLVGAACLAAAIGCQAPPQPTGPTLERVSVAQPNDRDQLWTVACDVLRDRLFRLDRQDRVNGVITTFPETSSQGWEFWRPQPQPAYYWWEANLQTIERQATVQMLPGERPDDLRVDVKVERLRYRLEERQIDNAAGALRIFSAEAPTVSGQKTKPSQTSYWYSLGRDEFMERTLLDAILKGYVKQTGNSPFGEITPSPGTQPATSQ